jgi:hypothetical protein
LAAGAYAGKLQIAQVEANWLCYDLSSV